ncbi:GTP cyclohydrolase 1 [Physcomitrium patens]|uniref:GTP cyclohydrolase 1 n=1 Tax=Physcomitrium patens TaxID=3218 RepID=A0A2K1JW72_PHYPA|nr:GTP cyclohydrolase 1-like [Physcomitrium patens]PNR45777.1 hypothetical protein PHYPA_015548 [Physcomitrium patens]|eukprot:XP_024389467.1 GTP cyclohydrolase 1-like [Physcomitrella patens]
MGALRERPIVTSYDECREDGCVLLRNGFHSAQGQVLEEWVEELHGESEDSSDASTIASVDGDSSCLPDMMSAVKVLLDGLGEDVSRDGLLKTPLRVAQAFQGATKGYRQAAKDVVGGALFMEPGTGGTNGSGGGCGGMVVVRNVELFALCEACLLPFRIRCHIAYVPVGERVVGLSKLPRVAEIFAKKLQNPRRFAYEVASSLTEALQPEPLGVAVAVESWHLQWPGVKENGVAADLEKYVGWVPSTAYAGTGQFEDKSGALWEELVALLQLESCSADNRFALDAEADDPNLSGCPFALFDGMPLQNGNSALLPSSCNGCGELEIVGNGLHKSSSTLCVEFDCDAPARPAMVAAVESLLRSVGEDPNRKELRLTSSRFVRWLLTSTQGSRVGTPGNLDLTAGIQGLFCEADQVPNVELVEDVMSTEFNFPFCSQCEHHLLPFVGAVHVAYLPQRRGRGKRQQLDRNSVQRVVRGYSLRLQVQERLTREIAEAIGGSVMVMVEASHMCMLSRGVQQVASSTSTYASLGLFSSNSRLRTAFLQSVAKRTKSG